MSNFTLSKLQEIIASRADEAPDVSYTASLLSKGDGKCAEKFGEEAVEAVIAAVAGKDAELTAEAADVLYHLLVVLKSRNIALEEVMAELERRTSQSGHAEKQSRAAK